MTAKTSAAKVLVDYLEPDRSSASRSERLVSRAFAATASGAAAPIARDPSEARVLGYLASHGPRRSIEVLDALVNDDDNHAEATLSDVAFAIDKLVAAGTIEQRQGEVISVLGDPRT